MKVQDKFVRIYSFSERPSTEKKVWKARWGNNVDGARERERDRRERERDKTLLKFSSERTNED